MENEFDCIKGLETIDQLISTAQLKRDEHDHLKYIVGEILRRLKRCDELETHEEK